MTIPSHHLGAKLTNPIGKFLYQIGFWAFACVGGTQGVNTPAFCHAACDQRPNANYFMKRVFWKAWPQGLTHFRCGGRFQPKHPGRGRKIRHRFQIPHNDRLFGHGGRVAQCPGEQDKQAPIHYKIRADADALAPQG
jgi:hypothetical protein